MADFDAWEDPHFLFQPKPTTKVKLFLFRLLVIVLFLSFIPLLPSEPPEFISRTVFANSWELVHLFIIGILVSYGLFSRRTTQTQTLNTPNMLHSSSIFSFEHHNNDPCGNQDSGFRPYGLEPTVVVKPGTFEFHYEPLDLPVRSLRSRVEESDSDANGSSSCCSEEENESVDVEEDIVGSSPTPWNWPNQSPSWPSLSNQSSPLRPSSSESPSMEREVEPTREENVLVSQPMSSKSIPMMADSKEEVDFKKVEDSRREAELFPSPTCLKSRSMRVDFKGKVGDASSDVDTNFMSPPSSERRDSRRGDVESSLSGPLIEENVFVSRPTPLLPMMVDPSEEFVNVNPRSFRPSSSKDPFIFRPSPAESLLIDVENARRETKSSLNSRSMRLGYKGKNGDTESVPPIRKLIQRPSPVFSPMCSAVPESPSTEMENLQKESKEMNEDLIPKRVRSRRRRPRKRDAIGQMKQRTDSLRSETSCDTTSSTSLSSSSRDFASIIEPKSSRYIDGLFLNESSTSELGGSSSLSKLERGRKTLSRTSHSRRFSCSSFFDRDLWKGSRDETKEINKKGKNADDSKIGKCGWDCLKLDVKPTLTAKGSARGKSVRTVRPPAITSEISCANERQDVVIISIGISQKNERSESSSLELDKNKERSHSVMEEVNEDEDGNSEIDRKADEFIAKFKEQIRQQKVVSRRESSKNLT